MTREEAIEFIAQSVKSDVDMAKVADAIKALEQEPNEVCDWFKQYIDIPSNTVLVEFSDGTSKKVKRGKYLANVENDLRRMMQVQIERESYKDAVSRDDVIRIVQHNNPPKALEKIRTLSSVTPQEPRKGHWVPYLKEGLIVKCSECKSRYTLGYNFCPKCGADMRR